MNLLLLRSAVAGWCLAASGALANPLTEGLVAHYPMTEMIGDSIPDVSGNDRGAFGDFIEVVDGLGRKVFAFDGANSVMHLPEDEALEIRGDFSIAFWVRVPEGLEQAAPIYAQPDFKISDSKGTLRVGFSHPEYGRTGYADLMGPRINDGEWHHVTFTYAGETGAAFLFVDGMEVATKVFLHKPEVSLPTTVGLFKRTYFTGELSDLRIYSKALEWDTAVALYQLESGS